VGRRLALGELHHPDAPHVGDAILGHVERLEQAREPILRQTQRGVRLLGPLRSFAPQARRLAEDTAGELRDRLHRRRVVVDDARAVNIYFRRARYT
jgi:hypothetical protein